MFLKLQKQNVCATNQSENQKKNIYTLATSIAENYQHRQSITCIETSVGIAWVLHFCSHSL